MSFYRIIEFLCHDDNSKRFTSIIHHCTIILIINVFTYKITVTYIQYFNYSRKVICNVCVY